MTIHLPGRAAPAHEILSELARILYEFAGDYPEAGEILKAIN